MSRAPRWEIVRPVRGPGWDERASLVTPVRVLCDGVEIPNVVALHVHLEVNDMPRLTLEIGCRDGLEIRPSDPSKD